MKVSLNSTFLILAMVATGLMSQPVTAQLEDKIPTRTLSEFADRPPGYCWYNQMALDQVSQHIPRDLTLIVIARLGAKERRADMNKRRLHNIREYLTRTVPEEYRRSPETIIVAEGERTEGRGRIEFYIQGRLIDVLIPYNHHDLLVSGCYDGIDGGEVCSTKLQRQFYPCKDQPPRKNTKRRVKRKK